MILWGIHKIPFFPSLGLQSGFTTPYRFPICFYMLQSWESLLISHHAVSWASPQHSLPSICPREDGSSWEFLPSIIKNLYVSYLAHINMILLVLPKCVTTKMFEIKSEKKILQCAEHKSRSAGTNATLNRWELSKICSIFVWTKCQVTSENDQIDQVSILGTCS